MIQRGRADGKVRARRQGAHVARDVICITRSAVNKPRLGYVSCSSARSSRGIASVIDASLAAPTLSRNQPLSSGTPNA